MYLHTYLIYLCHLELLLYSYNVRSWISLTTLLIFFPFSSLNILIYKEPGAIMTKWMNDHHEIHGVPLNPPLPLYPEPLTMRGAGRTGNCWVAAAVATMGCFLGWQRTWRSSSGAGEFHREVVGQEELRGAVTGWQQVLQSSHRIKKVLWSSSKVGGASQSSHRGWSFMEQLRGEGNFVEHRGTIGT